MNASATERELLDLAAKAAGVEQDLVLTDPRFITWRSQYDSEGYNQPWNPLTDDGDALRLAVKLEITPGKHEDTVVASRSASWRSGSAHCSLWEPEEDDPYAATRRAIVRAAAEIGKQLTGAV